MLVYFGTSYREHRSLEGKRKKEMSERCMALNMLG